MAISIQLNGNVRTVAEVGSPVALRELVEALGLKADRIAVELNGEIASRAAWGQVLVGEGDRLEIVHFVGGGSDSW